VLPAYKQVPALRRGSFTVRLDVAPLRPERDETLSRVDFGRPPRVGGYDRPDLVPLCDGLIDRQGVSGLRCLRGWCGRLGGRRSV
jgi:hypothetical protein